MEAEQWAHQSGSVRALHKGREAEIRGGARWKVQEVGLYSPALSPECWTGMIQVAFQ